MKTIEAIYSPPSMHWVGDGFPVRTLFSYDRMAPKSISPFLLLDYAGPAEFSPSKKSRGVGQHPHRGFETVTIVYQGELEHRDSSGGGGLIGAGDVQWMTAGAGIMHEEFHSQEFTRNGGRLEMVQLWVNLPANSKQNPARYQSILDADIPKITLGDGVGEVRIIAGIHNGQRGPATTHSFMNVWDVALQTNQKICLPVPAGHNTLIMVRRGSVLINDHELVGDAQLAICSQQGEEITLASSDNAQLLILSGEAINEPVVGHGPFVMNSREEIQQAMKDFQSGRFGMLNT